MKKGKLIVIEGTDCSGKETQTTRLVENLNEKGYPSKRFSFPMYDTPTGKIIGGPFLGKKDICEGWFKETAPNVDPKVGSLFYAADRLYNKHYITDELDKGVNVILDRYTYSNMAHQAGKIEDEQERNEMYEWVSNLEFEVVGLPKPDFLIFIHMPYEGVMILKEGRLEEADENEKDDKNIINSLKAYMEIAKKYNFKVIECTNGSYSNITRNDIRSIDSINEEITNYVLDELAK